MMIVGAMLAMAAMTAQEEPKAQISRDVMMALFGPNSYPPAAIRAAEQGRVVADLAIDARGRVTTCTIVEAASAILAEQTCRLVVSGVGLFSPAKDARGKAVASHYSLKIRWKLPEGTTPVSPADVPTTFRVVAEPDGRVKECEVGKPSQDRPLVQGGPMCDELARRLVGAISRHTGKPLAQQFEGRFLIDYALNAGSHNIISWPKDMIILNDMSVTYGVTAQGRNIECKRDIRAWDKAMPVPSPCDGQTKAGPATTPDVPVSSVDALLRLGYRFLPETQ